MSKVATLPAPPAQAIATATDILASPAQFEHMQRVARVFCASALIPQHLRGNNGADAVLALAIAKRMGEDPVMVMQNIYVVHGRAGWSAQYMIARANRSGVFKGPISWRESGSGDNYSVTAFAKAAETGDEVSFTVSMAMAKAEGWTKNTKYQTMGPLMLRYRSATLLIRLYCPEVMMGMPGADELQDVAAAQMRDVTPAAEVTAALQPPPVDPEQIVTADGEIIDQGATEGEANATIAAPAGAETVGPAAPEAPEIDFGAPSPGPVQVDVIKLARDITMDLHRAKTLKAVNGVIASRAADLAMLKERDPEGHDEVTSFAAARKAQLAGSTPA